MKKRFSRPEVITGCTYKIRPVSWDAAVYITINSSIVDNKLRPVEIFINSKHAPSVAMNTLLSRLLSAQMQQDGPFPEFIISELIQTHDADGGYIIPKSGGQSVHSVAAHIGLTLKRHWDFVKRSNEQSAVKEGEDCPVISAECEYYSYQLDSNEEVAICHCTHPNNPNEHEGNCTHTLCPLNPPSTEHS